MKTEDYQKTLEELKEEINKSNEQIKISDERKRMANVNQFEYKALGTLGFSVVPYLILFFLLMALTKNGIITSLRGIIPAELFSYAIEGGSLSIGALVIEIFKWKFKSKERLKAFTTAKTQSELIQEEVKYAIELEKAINRKKAIKQAIDLLDSKQSISNSLSDQYDIRDKTIPQTEKDAKRKVEDLSLVLKGKYDELDVLTVQKVLHEKFWRVRSVLDKVLSMIIAPLLVGFITMIYVDLPLIIVKDYLFSSGLISMFAPFIAGIMGAGGYMIKRQKDYIKAFNNLNKELGENALPNKIKESYEERKDIDAKIESKINEISKVEFKLQEQKRNLESFSTDDSEKEQTIEPLVAKEQTIEVTIDNGNESRYTQEDLMIYMDDDIFAGAEEEPQSEDIGYTQEGYTQDDLMAFIDEKIIEDKKGEKKLLFVSEDK